MSSTSSKYDKCNTIQDLEQCYKRPNENMFQTYKFQHDNPIRNQFGLVGGNEVSLVCDDLVGFESDLLGLNKYKNIDNKPITDGSVCKDDISFMNVSEYYNELSNGSSGHKNVTDLDGMLRDLPNGQLIDYKNYDYNIDDLNNTSDDLNNIIDGAEISEAFNSLR